MSKTHGFIGRLLRSRRRQTAEDALLSVAEDKRLRALGINPSGDPVDVMIRLRAKMREIERREDKKPGERPE